MNGNVMLELLSELIKIRRSEAVNLDCLYNSYCVCRNNLGHTELNNQMFVGVAVIFGQ